MHLLCEIYHVVHRFLIRLQLEQRRPQVEMQAHDLKVRLAQRYLNCALGISSLYRKAELRIQHAGRCESMRMWVNAGGQSQHGGLSYSDLACNFVQQLDFVKRVDRDASEPDLQRLCELIPRLVVAMEVNVTCGKPCRHCNRKLTAGHDIQRQTLALHQLQYRRIGKRLGRVLNSAVSVSSCERIDECPAHATDRRGIVDIERRAVLVRQLANRHATNRQLTVRRHVCCHR